MNDYNRRFSKAPRQAFDVHRERDVDDDPDTVFNGREARHVSKSLTVQYDKVLYLIADSEFSRRAMGKYIDVWHYPDGRRQWCPSPAWRSHVRNLPPQGNSTFGIDREGKSVSRSSIAKIEFLPPGQI